MKLPEPGTPTEGYRESVDRGVGWRQMGVSEESRDRGQEMRLSESTCPQHHICIFSLALVLSLSPLPAAVLSLFYFRVVCVGPLSALCRPFFARSRDLTYTLQGIFVRRKHEAIEW